MRGVVDRCRVDVYCVVVHYYVAGSVSSIVSVAGVVDAYDVGGGCVGVAAAWCVDSVAVIVVTGCVGVCVGVVVL